jgi:hypothetical protein
MNNGFTRVVHGIRFTNERRYEMNKISVLPFNTGEIAASGNYTTEAIDLSKLSNEHRLSLQVSATGDGTATIEILCSNDNVNFVDSGTDVLTDQAAGNVVPTILTTSMCPYCRWIKIKVTETSTTDAVTVVMSLFVQ